MSEQIQSVKVSEAAAKLARELPPDLASKAEFIVAALQRAATHELLAGEPTTSMPQGPGKELSTQDTQEPVGEPGAQDTKEPTVEPGAQNTKEPTGEPGAQNTKKPTGEPGAQNTEEPTGERGAQNTKELTREPGAQDALGSESEMEPGAQEPVVQEAGQKADQNKQDKKAAHAAWMRMHRQLRSSSFAASYVLYNLKDFFGGFIK